MLAASYSLSPRMSGDSASSMPSALVNVPSIGPMFPAPFACTRLLRAGKLGKGVAEGVSSCRGLTEMEQAMSLEGRSRVVCEPLEEV